MDFGNVLLSMNVQNLVQAFHRILFRFLESRIRSTDLVELGSRKVTADGVRNDKVSIGKSLHQSGCAQAVRTVVREVRFAQDKAARNRTHQVVVHPEAAHRIMGSRIDAHRNLVRIFVGDFFIHLEQVAVFGGNACDTHTLDGIGKVQINGTFRRTDTHALVADHLRIAGSHITRDQVSKRRIAFFQIVIALAFRNFICRTGIADFFRHPDTSIITEGFAHQSQLGLVIARHRNASRVNLCVAGIRKERTFLISLPSRADIAALRIRRKIEHVAVAASRQADRIRFVAFQSSRHQIANHDSASLAVDDDQVLHIATRENLDRTLRHLTHQSLISAEKKLLSGLSTSIERAGNLGSAKRTVSQKSTVVTSKRNALRHALVDNQIGVFGKAVHVRFTSTEVAAFYRIIEQTVNGVAIVRVILRRIDTALSGNRVGTARRILIAESQNIVAEFSERSGSACAGKTGSHHNHLEFTLVRGVHQFKFKFMASPLFGDISTRNMSIQFHLSDLLLRCKKLEIRQRKQQRRPSWPSPLLPEPVFSVPEHFDSGGPHCGELPSPAGGQCSS